MYLPPAIKSPPLAMSSWRSSQPLNLKCTLIFVFYHIVDEPVCLSNGGDGSSVCPHGRAQKRNKKVNDSILDLRQGANQCTSISIQLTAVHSNFPPPPPSRPSTNIGWSCDAGVGR
ncbi:unnamed protein product [Schistocephalus solidus]|uniref:Uncharacterized protein n=1 Tax=Schistocephalus solidus TaxID=70667 RepID=A0A183TRQ2_SCHSO|nr:unnamed protein product [Schistocephalus solidus]